MNGKRAKILRKAAQKNTVGLPDVEYMRHQTTGMRKLIPNCTRAMYQGLKRVF